MVRPAALSCFDAVEDVVARLRVDADGRLVEKDDLRIVNEGDGHVEPPLHAAGVGFHAVAAAVLEAGELQGPGDALLQPVARESW